MSEASISQASDLLDNTRDQSECKATEKNGYKRKYDQNLIYSDSLRIDLDYEINFHAEKIKKVAEQFKVNYSSVKKILRQNKYKIGKRFKHQKSYIDLNCPVVHEVKQNDDFIKTPKQCSIYLY